MKKFLFFILFIIVNNVSAQLYVKNNTFIFDKGSLVYAKGNLELNGANSILYLRNEGQLIQGTIANSSNKGLGKLSVFQEGTSNNYAYNYWCSPVGNASSTIGNEDFGITMLSLPTTKTTSVSPVILAMNNYDGLSSNGSLSIAPYWVWKYQSGTTYPEWIQAGSNSSIAAGQGFTMKGTGGTDATDVGEIALNNPGSAQRYDFRGKPNDGNIIVTVAPLSNTLTGNPYPSSMNVQDFLMDASNSACTGIAYYWEQDKSVNSHLMLVSRGGYGTYAPGLGVNGTYAPATYYNYNIDGSQNTSISGTPSLLNINRKYAPIGQGFEIEGTTTGGSVTIKNSYRAFKKESVSTDLSGFEKIENLTQLNATHLSNSNQAAQIRLNTLLNNQYNRQIILGFQDNATDGVDKGIDAKSPNGEDLSNDSYFFIDNNPFVIQGVKFDLQNRIPIGIKMGEAGMVSFRIPYTVNFDENQAIYLYDALDNSYHDILNQAYEINVPVGVYNNRFELTFTNAVLSMNNSNFDSVTVCQNNNSHLLTVTNNNAISIEDIVIYDVLGKLIFKQSKLDSPFVSKISTASFSDGFYVVKIYASDGYIKSQKIIISNAN